MEKEFVPYTLALEMKSIGFDEPCLGCYVEGSEKMMFTHRPVNSNNITYVRTWRNSDKDDVWSAPTYSQCFRWFREKYNLICRVDVTSYGCPLNEQEFYCEITSKNGTASYEIFNTYEEAELACLKKLIQIVKEKL